MLIRPATLDDVPAVRAQLIETWHATYDSLYGFDTVVAITQRWHSLMALRAQIDQPDSIFLLAEDDEAIVASSYACAEKNVAKLYRLYVRPAVQRRAIGQRLLAATFAMFPDAQSDRLEVEPRNAQAIAFYEREGFVRVGAIGDVGHADGTAAYIYERARLTETAGHPR